MQEETREYQKVISYLSQMIAGGEFAGLAEARASIMKSFDIAVYEA